MRFRIVSASAAVAFLLPTLFSCQSIPVPSPVRKPDLRVLSGESAPAGGWSDARAVDSVLSTLTLEEKVAQMIMLRVPGYYLSTDGDLFDRLVRKVTVRKVGGLILTQGDVFESVMTLNALQRLAPLPLLVAADFEKGIAMRIRRGTSFPDAMALGAARKPDLALRMGKAIALEGRAIGVHENYAPVADINTNPANPAINTRAFTDDPVLDSSLVAAFVRGCLEGGQIPTAKHFPGHGDTGDDSHLTLPVLSLSRSRLDSVELKSFRSSIDAGVPAVMVGHLLVPALDSLNRPASLSPAVIQSLLRTSMKFTGLVVTDALEMRGVTRGGRPGDVALLAVKAGVDVLLVPPDEDDAMSSIVAAVTRGEIPVSRIDESVRRILEAKRWAGLDRNRLVDPGAVAAVVGSRKHLALAREIGRSGITVLKNEGDLLPLPLNSNKRIAVVMASDVEDNRREIDRPGPAGSSEPVGNYFAQMVRRRSPAADVVRIDPASSKEELEAARTAVRRSDIAVVALYVKVRTGTGTVGLPDYLKGFVASLSAAKTPLCVCSFGSPYVVADVPGARAVVCAYGDTEPQELAAAEALFGEIAVQGKLPVGIPGAYAYGSGIDLPQTRLRREDPWLAGIDPERLQGIEEMIDRAIADSLFPGAVLAIVKGGMIVEHKTFGRQTFDSAAVAIDAGTMYDLASLTKVVATTPALMRLYDLGKFSLDDTVAKYLPAFAAGGKESVTIRQLLLHRGGLPPFRQFWTFCPDSLFAVDSVLATPVVARPGDTTIYSDIGMITLGKLVEKLSGMSLSQFVQKEFFVPLRMTGTMFTPPPELRAHCAPTEIDTVWRKRLVQGTVHDENAEFLGGVSGHAGLFSTATDLATFAQMMLNKGTYGGRRYISEGTMYEFLGRRSPGQERWLGWDMRAATGSSSGSHFSRSSFGHTGFTGTSIWIDPERSLGVVFLTNRVYPTRANRGLLGFRPRLHDAVIHALEDTGDK
jgi:beta-N-acetylhexosaminidase